MPYIYIDMTCKELSHTCTTANTYHVGFYQEAFCNRALISEHFTSLDNTSVWWYTTTVFRKHDTLSDHCIIKAALNIDFGFDDCYLDIKEIK